MRVVPKDNSDPLPPPRHDEAGSEDMLADENLALECNLWDAALLIGLKKDGKPVMNVLSSVFVVLLACCNIAIQATIIRAIQTSMTEDPFDESFFESIRRQRLYTNHAWEQKDFSQMESLAVQLCEGEAFNRMGGTSQDVRTYLQSDTGGVGGTVVASMALIIWILSMTTEFRRTFELLTAVLGLQHAGPGLDNVVADREEDCMVVERQGYFHKLFCCIVISIRLVVAVLLLYFGMQFLTHTVAVSDMILNACALEIVKSVDEMLFEAVSAVNIKLLVEHTRLKFNGSARPDVQMGMVFVRLLFISVWFMVGYFALLLPFHDNVVQTAAEICGGDKNFAYIIHPVSSLPYFSATTDFAETEYDDPSALQCFYEARYQLILMRAGGPMTDLLSIERNVTLQMIVNGTHSSCNARAEGGGPRDRTCISQSLGFLKTMRSVTADEYYEDPMFCQDQNVHMNVLAQTCTFPKHAESVPFFGGRSTCADFSEICTCTAQMSTGPGGTCIGPDYAEIQKRYNITVDWIEILQSVCPTSCGMCKKNGGDQATDQSSQAGGESVNQSANSVGRRLQSMRDEGWQRKVQDLEARNEQLEQRLAALEEFLYTRRAEVQALHSEAFGALTLSGT